MNKLDLETFAKVSIAINSTLDVKSLLSLIMNKAKELIKSEGSSLMLMDYKENNLKFYIATGEKSYKLTDMRVPLGEGVAGKCAQNRIPVIVNKEKTDIIYRKVDETTEFETRNLICVPLIKGKKVIGVLECVNSIGRDEFAQDDLDVLQYLANQAAIAINNRQLYDKLEKAYQQITHRANELSALYDLQLKTNYVISESLLFESALSTITSILDCDKCTILTLNSKKDALIVQASKGDDDFKPEDYIPLDKESLITNVFKSNEALLVKNASNDENLKKLSKDEFKNSSFLFVPIIFDNENNGIIHVSEKIDDTEFTESDKKILFSIASHTGQAFSKLNLQRELIEGEKIKRDLETASKIQQRIIPKTFPEDDFIEVYGISKPAQEVGGDFYDIIEIDKNKSSFVIGDVSGKGVPAAIFMALARNVIRAEAKHLSKPGDLFKNANLHLYEDSEQGMFVTCAYFLIEKQNRIIYWSNAGHNHQILYRAATNELEQLLSRGLPLGAMDFGEYPNKITNYEKGDYLILYTDGVTEALNKNAEEFGEDRLSEYLRRNIDKTPKEIVNGIYEEVNNFAIGCPQYDDFTMLVVKLS